MEINWDQLQPTLIDMGISLVSAIAILIIGMWVAKVATKLVRKAVQKKEMDKSLESFLVSGVSITLKILVVISALSTLGLEMTSFVALIGAAGLAVGMALSGTLQNFAGGVMLLIFKPFKVGDYVKAQGEEGIVKEIQIFNTILNSVDNKVVILPNGSVANGNITNFSQEDLRRVDFTVGIGYGDDYNKAKSVLERFIAEDSNILKDPAPFIGLVELADSSVNLTLRVWSKSADYWAIYFKMNEKIYKEFGQEGLNIPYPQMDVHVQNAK